jgi:hypothetical protein
VPNLPVQQSGGIGSTDDGAIASVVSAANDIISVTAGSGGTLKRFTWFRYTWSDSHRARCYGLVLGYDTDRNDSLVSRPQAYTSEGDRVELSRC